MGVGDIGLPERLVFKRIDDYHLRAKIYGGWLVKAFSDVAHFLPYRGCEVGCDYRVSICFVPDPKHEWALIEKEEVAPLP